MQVYTNFIGIDIGKKSFVVNIHGRAEVKEYENSDEGIQKFLTENKARLGKALTILETTGGYEMDLLLCLCRQAYAVHRANTRKVKNFIRSYGNTAKTDALDAKALALYGFERQSSLRVYEPANDNELWLYELTSRRRDLKKMLAAEKNRLQAPRTNWTEASCEKVITLLKQELIEIDAKIDELIAQDETLSLKRKAATSVAGIGPVISSELVVLVPELGNLNRREIASLLGLAPRANESGQFKGYRSTGHGRSELKDKLFLAAMAARNSNSHFKTFFNELIGRGKPPKVALIAVARKIIVTVNARVRDALAGVAQESS